MMQPLRVPYALEWPDRTCLAQYPIWTPSTLVTSYSYLKPGGGLCHIAYRENLRLHTISTITTKSSLPLVSDLHYESYTQDYRICL